MTTTVESARGDESGAAELAARCLPLFLAGEVVKGFGRGSRELGIPTANLAEEAVQAVCAQLPTGIYYGWASVTGASGAARAPDSDRGAVHKMVMSVGWNPYYENTKKSAEVHILHHFADDFYGALLRILIVGYLRPERDFDSVDALVSAIHDDIARATQSLDAPELLAGRADPRFA